MPARQAVISLPVSEIAVLERFEAVERLSELFVIEADVLSEDAIDFLPALGKGALITVSNEANERTFSGLIYEVELSGQSEAGNRYRLTLRPWLYALTKNLDFVIYQKKSVSDILQDIFHRRNCNDFDFSKLTKNYPTREYTVQYRESDFDFISRLMEEEGIYYYFAHRDGRHTMVLCDDRGSHEKGAYDELRFVPADRVAVIEDRVWRWTESVVTGSEDKATFRSYDHVQPKMNLEGVHQAAPDEGGDGESDEFTRRLSRVSAAASEAMSSEKVDVYDYTATFTDTSRGQTLAETRMLSLNRVKRSYRGESDAVLLTCGSLLDIADHPIGRLDQSYLITGLTYRLTAETYTSGGGGGEGGEEPVIVGIAATPAEQPWRAPQTTPRPQVWGPETATVVGPDGETIYTDEYGRVKVKFHWDRIGSGADTTCWIRVASASADSGFGHVALPRIGQEVVVDFLNGNPDNPLIVGSVFNADKKQPYALADDKTRSVWRSHTINGGADDYNEISMEDKTGSEIFNVQAQKDRTTLVKNDDTKTIGNNLKTTIQKGDETRTLDQGNRSTDIKMGNDTLKIDMGNSDTDLKMGNYSLKCDLGAVTVEAMQSITLKVGASSVVIDQMGVTVKGMMISLQAQVQLQGQAVMTQISGSAMTQITGGIIMIN
jgi:type VI secretion system secreted protein VgrG